MSLFHNETKIGIQDDGAVTYYADYFPFGWTLPGRNSGDAYLYAYQGQEKDGETGWEAFVPIAIGIRMYDGRVGRWMTTDPYSQYHSPYLAMGNNPISLIDPDGGWSGDPKSYTFPEVVITATPLTSSNQNINPTFYDQSAVRYGYNGDWTQYKKNYGLEDWSYENYSNYYHTVHREDFNNWVTQQDIEERERIAVEKMSMFILWFEMIGTVVAPGSGVSTRAGGISPRGVNLKNLDLNSYSKYVYRSLNTLDAQNVANGNGLSAKAPNGKWTLEEHLIRGSSPKSWLNDPWISTSPNLNIVRGFDGGNGIVKINLTRLNQSTIHRHIPPSAITILKF